MKKEFYSLLLVVVILTSCGNDNNAVFDKTADERVAEAINNLKEDLISPANGWRLKYRPETESGSFHVLLDFDADNKVTIKSDLGSNKGQFFEQTVTYRIDNSLGLELIIESYSFFSFLFEQDQATFGAEFEFDFVNKTPDDDLVFRSKTDLGTATILLFEPAAANDITLLGTQLATNLNTISSDFQKFSSSLRLTYVNKDLVLNVVLDEFRRTLNINSGAKKSNLQVTQSLNFTSPYIITGDSIVLDSRFTAAVLSNNISFKGIKLSTLSEGTLNVCADPITVHSYNGVTSANDLVNLETGLSDPSGRTFAQVSDFYFAPLNNVFSDGVNAGAAIAADITGAGSMQLYYNYDLGNGPPFYAIGFFIQNTNGTTTFALRQFTPTLTDNNIVFNFAPDISIFGSQDTDANTDNINIYLDALTQGDNTYVFKLQDNVYEFYNPCTKWSFVFLNANR